MRRPLIGADFLTNSSLLVDLRNNQLVHPGELNATPLQRTKRKAKMTGLAFTASANPSTLAKVLAEFLTVTVPNFKIDKPKHVVRHTIETRGQPIRAKARPLPPQKLAAAKANFAEMATAGIFRPIEWAMVFASARGNEKRRQFPDVRRLSMSQSRHDTRPVFHTADRRPYRTTARKEVFWQSRHGKRVPPNTGS